MNERKIRSKVTTVSKKLLSLKSQFLNDSTEEIITQRLEKATQKTFNATKPNTVLRL